MWQAASEFLLKAHASKLSHEAVIEIMIALLGVMIMVLTLISGLFAAAVTIAGVFGFNLIRTEAGNQAAEVARETATKIADEVVQRIWADNQAADMSESQAESDGDSKVMSEQLAPLAPEALSQIDPLSKKRRRKATSDSNLKGGDEK